MAVVVTIGGATGLAARLSRFLESEFAESTASMSAPRTAADTVTIEAADETLVGLALGWLLVNRPAQSQCALSIQPDGDGDAGSGGGGTANRVELPPVRALKDSDSVDDFAGTACNGNTAAACNINSAAAAAAHSGWPEANPVDCVEVYHLHCHFNDQPGSEQAAKALLDEAKAAMVAHGVTPLHDHLWHEKNGPHDPWSWELWAETPRALGIAVAHLMQWRRPARAHALGLYLSIHADTDQEFTDHTLRFGWIGPADPHPLDVGFFTPPSPGYGGPALHARRSTAATLYSMGDPWPRDPATGAIRKEAYAAQDRPSVSPKL